MSESIENLNEYDGTEGYDSVHQSNIIIGQKYDVIDYNMNNKAAQGEFLPSIKEKDKSRNESRLHSIDTHRRVVHSNAKQYKDRVGAMSLN